MESCERFRKSQGTLGVQISFRSVSGVLRKYLEASESFQEILRVALVALNGVLRRFQVFLGAFKGSRGSGDSREF